MFKILKKEYLANNIWLMDVEAPRVAKSCQPGQFVIVKTDEEGERIPLTVCDYDREKGTVTIVFQTVGASTTEMSRYEVGESFMDFVGPLGCASELIEMPVEELKKEKLLFVCGGVGTAPVYPQVKWMKEHGIDVDVIIGARTKDIMILVNELVKNLNKTYTRVVAIGPMIMMKFVAMLTKELNIPTIVSMNPIMVDGTGMCGACRLKVGDEIKFACVDGPEFDGHLVDFDQAMRRQRMYKTEEGRAMLKLEEGDTHHGGCGQCNG